MAGISGQSEPPHQISISPLLKDLAGFHLPSPTPVQISASSIAAALAEIFENRISTTQLSAFLTLLHSTGKDRDPEVISKCAKRMREAASQIDKPQFRQVIGKRKRVLGNYQGGVCDIVGTGGDYHSTFNISTTSSIIASPLIKMAKHGSRAQTSKSGSADVLLAISPKAPNITAVNADNLPALYEKTNYAFLFAPNFHPGLRHAATVRKELGLRTIFNFMGPLASPVDWALEARVVGVAYQQLGPVFAEALRISGASKSMVVCGEEDLDELSCAGRTNCWFLKEKTPNAGDVDLKNGQEDSSDDEDSPRSTAVLETFSLHPSDFGLPCHPLSQVGGGKGPNENASMLLSILRNELSPDHPILHFVLINVAALLVVSGVCEADTSETGEVIKERGPGGGRWKEGVRLARWCIESGKALQELEKFIEFTNQL